MSINSSFHILQFYWLAFAHANPVTPPQRGKKYVKATMYFLIINFAKKQICIGFLQFLHFLNLDSRYIFSYCVMSDAKLNFQNNFFNDTENTRKVRKLRVYNIVICWPVVLILSYHNCGKNIVVRSISSLSRWLLSIKYACW